MKTKWLKYVLCMALVVAFLSSCNDEDPISNKVEEGLSASMNLSVGVPVIEPVEITRGINDYESMIDELVLVMFSHTSPRKEILDLTNKIASVESNDNTGYRKYSLTEDVKTRSGEYTVYAIANFTSPYCGLTLAELQDENLTEAKLKDKLARNVDKVYELLGSHRMPMTQVIDNYTILSDEEVKNGGKKNTLELQLKRIMAHIEFNFVNAKDKEGKDIVSFTPYEYTIYHLPDGSYLMNHDNNLIDNSTIEDDNDKVHYFNTEAINTGGSTFDFFMLENVRERKELSNYNERDKWIRYNPDGSKDFTNAPDSSTYIVVKGTYYGTGIDKDNVSKYYAGECTYTIHLGGNKDNGDFSINRNEFHKYTITISGVNTITKEALGSVEDKVYGGDIPGAEGVLRLVSNTFILDAHYERVRVEISKDNYENYLNNKSKGEHTILINTPKTGHGDKTIKLTPKNNEYDSNDYNSKEDDIYWIHFIKPEDIEKVPRYEKAKAGNILKFLSEPENYCIQGSDGNYYTYAYVDEYFYEDIHPKEFVNVMNRSFILDPKDISESDDKNSTVIDFLLLDVSQRSIKSSFDMNKIQEGDLPYGIETWNETAGLLWNEVTDTPTDLSSDQGLVNTKRLLTANNIKTLNDNVWSYIGYRYNVSSNSKARHRWYDAKHYKDWETKYTDEDIDENINENVTNPLVAVLARNRVYLDNDNEIILDSIKWYLPGICQYLITWLGQNRLQEDTRLMDVSLLTQYNGAGAMDYAQHYFTSSTTARRVYWQDQGACWSRIVDWKGDDNHTGGAPRNKMRCMRNLRNDFLDKQLNDGLSKKSPVVFPVKREGRTFIMGAIANSRSQYMEGGYNIHTERETENYLYSKFKVATPAKGYFYNRANNVSAGTGQTYYCCGFSLPTGTSWGYDSKIVESMNSIAATYYEEEDRSDLGKWRVPNQRELMIIAIMDNNMSDPILPKGLNNRVNVLTTTWFTGWQNTKRIIPFMFDSGSSGGSDYVMTLADGLSGSSVLLFVRDVE